MLKKLLCIILCVTVFCSVLVVPANSLAITLGTGALAGILASALLAAGVTVVAGSSDDYSAALEAIIESMSENELHRLQTVGILTTAAGTTVANWSSEAWNWFTDWVQSNFFLDGSTSFTYISEGFIDDYTYPVLQKSSYNEYLNVVLGVVYSVALSRVANLDFKFLDDYKYIDFNLHLSDGTLIPMPQASQYSVISNSTFFLSKSIINSAMGYKFYFGTLNSRGSFVQVGSQSLFPHYHINYDDVTYTVRLQNNKILLNTSDVINTEWYRNAVSIYEFPSDAVDVSLGNWILKCIGTGTLVGDLTGLGYDVVNPGDIASGNIDCDVSVDDVPGTNEQTLPDVINPGQSISIPIIGADVVGDSLSIPDVGDVYRDLAPSDVLPNTTVSTDTGELDIPDVEDIPTDDTDSPNKNANKLKFPKVAMQKFPFCIPFDLVDSFKMLSAPVKSPVWNVPFNVPSLGFNQNVTIDLTVFEPVRNVLQWLIIALFILSLILLTKQIIK